MKHFILSDELKKDSGFDERHPNLHVYSCEFDDGSKAQGNFDIIRLGGDGMEVWFFPCHSCYQQLMSHFVEEILDKKINSAMRKELIKTNKKLHEIVEMVHRINPND